VLGVAIVVSLMAYNLQDQSIWSSPRTVAYRSWEEFLLVNVTALLFPAMLWLAVLRESPALFGMRPPKRHTSRIAFAMYVLMLPLLVIASRQSAFQNYYPIQPMAAISWRYFLYFEITYGLYMFCWEFFYRGFLTMGLARAFHPALAIGLQAVAFGAMHYGKPAPELAGSFVAGIALGWLALHARSFLPCFVLHWAIAVTFDVLVILGKPGGFL
jgi:uncharacterized protein